MTKNILYFKYVNICNLIISHQMKKTISYLETCNVNDSNSILKEIKNLRDKRMEKEEEEQEEVCQD